MPLIRLGDWTLDPSDGTLASPLARKHLEPRVQAVLQLLIDRRGTVVSQEEIFREVWRDTFVAATALARTMSMLRQALEDDVRQPRYIETVPKRGYRLIASVEPLIAPEPEPVQVEAESTAPIPRWPRVLVAVAAGIILALAADHDAFPQMDDVAGKRPPGMFHDRLWHDTRLGNETAFEHYTQELARHPASVDALAGLAMVYAFRTIYMPDQPHWVDAALETAQRAVGMDPLNLPAARALAIAQTQAGRLNDAARGFERLLQLNPGDHASRTNLGQVLTRVGRLDAALSVFDEQLAVEPHWVWGYAGASVALAAGGYLDEAVRVAEAGIRLEPLLLDAHLTVSRADLVRGRYPSARTRLERLVAAHADCAHCVVELGLAEQLLGRTDEARRHYERALTMTSPSAAALRLAHLRQLEGDRAGAEALLREIEGHQQSEIERSVELSVPGWVLAAAAAVRGDREAALRWYARAVQAGRADVTWDGWDPMFNAIQHTADFKELSERMLADQRAMAPVAARIAGRLDRTHLTLHQVPQP